MENIISGFLIVIGVACAAVYLYKVVPLGRSVTDYVFITVFSVLFPFTLLVAMAQWLCILIDKLDHN